MYKSSKSAMVKTIVEILRKLTKELKRTASLLKMSSVVGCWDVMNKSSKIIIFKSFANIV